MKHYLLAIPFASYSGDNPADGYFLHVSTGRTDASQGYNFIGNGEPQMEGLLTGQTPHKYCTCTRQELWQVAACFLAGSYPLAFDSVAWLVQELVRLPKQE